MGKSDVTRSCDQKVSPIGGFFLHVMCMYMSFCYVMCMYMASELCGKSWSATPRISGVRKSGAAHDVWKETNIVHRGVQSEYSRMQPIIPRENWTKEGRVCGAER